MKTVLFVITVIVWFFFFAVASRIGANAVAQFIWFFAFVGVNSILFLIYRLGVKK